jgi:hypothetical protein
MSTGAAECATTAAATLPTRWPANPLWRWEPTTITLAWCATTVSRIPFQVGAASTATLVARNPAAAASDAPWAAVSSAALRTSGARSASKCCLLRGTNPTSTGCQTQRTKASRPNASNLPASSMAVAASSDPSKAKRTGPVGTALSLSVQAISVNAFGYQSCRRCGRTNSCQQRR